MSGPSSPPCGDGPKGEPLKRRQPLQQRLQLGVVGQELADLVVSPRELPPQ